MTLRSNTKSHQINRVSTNNILQMTGNKKGALSACFITKYGRNGGIWTHDPYTPSIVRYLAALRSDSKTFHALHMSDAANKPASRGTGIIP